MKYITFTVPCYNSAAYMERCVDSLLIGGEDVEILLIDDGSTDRTGEIAVTFSDLSFQTYNVSAETEKFAHGDLHFAEDLVVPNQRIQSSAADVASFVDVYDFVESRLSGEQEQHHDAGNLQQIIAAEIDNY